jgi:asparagine synthase (glutamine-hydrolysing)
VGFGHRRLAIIDLSQAAAQPMQRFGLTITYNGEIYNYIELRKELEKQGMIFTTQSDTEVVLAAYACWGKNCVNRFRGMWAMAIYNPADQTIFFSRDRFGEKPLYYTQQANQFIFCSEIKGILQILQGAVANKRMLLHFLVFERTTLPTETFFKEVYKLNAGCNALLHLQSGKWETWQYYAPSPVTHPQYTEQEGVQLFKEKMAEAVRLCMRSDVPIGTCLSGGLDSSYVAAIAAGMQVNNADNRFAAVTAASVDAQNNEAPFARMVAQQFGLQWHEITPDTNAFYQSIQQVVRQQEEPIHSTSVVMQSFVMRAAKAAGIKVLLDGQGADELLLGYPVHLGVMLRQLAPWPATQLAANAHKHYAFDWLQLAKIWAYHSHPIRKTNRQLAQWQKLLQPSCIPYVNNSWAKAAEKAIQTSAMAYQQWDISVGNLPMLLQYEDKNGMAFSVETRLPYLDYKLVDWCLGLPDVFKINKGWSKYILRQAMAGWLDDDITWRRRKIGFEAPDKFWMADAGYFSNVIAESDLLRALGNSSLYSVKNKAIQWRLFALASWEKAYRITLI